MDSDAEHADAADPADMDVRYLIHDRGEERGKVVDMPAFGEWAGRMGGISEPIAVEEVGDTTVSTVFLASFFSKRLPICRCPFETAIIDHEKGIVPVRNYETLSEALAGHTEIKAALAADLKSGDH